MAKVDHDRSRVFESVLVFKGLGFLGWVGSWLQGLTFVWPDKNDPKCIVGFDSDTFSKTMLKTTEKLKFGQNEVIQDVFLKRCGRKMGQNAMWGSGETLKSTVPGEPPLLLSSPQPGERSGCVVEHCLGLFARRDESAVMLQATNTHHNKKRTQGQPTHHENCQFLETDT